MINGYVHRVGGKIAGWSRWPDATFNEPMVRDDPELVAHLATRKTEREAPPRRGLTDPLSLQELEDLLVEVGALSRGAVNAKKAAR